MVSRFLRTGLWALVVCLWASSPALAARATLEMDVPVLQVGQVAALRLVLVDAQANSAPVIQAPAAVSVAYQGQSQSMVSVNFKTSRTFTYTYAITALIPGTVQLGPVTVRTRTGDVVSDSLSLTIRPREAESARNNKAEAYLGAENAVVRDRTYQLWAGQTVVYHFLFRHAGSVVDARWTPPDFEGFVADPTVPQDQREYQVKEGDTLLTVHAIDVPLMASSSGTRSIRPAAVSAQFPVPRTGGRRSPVDELFEGGFGALGQTRTEVFTSEPLSVQVRDLPTEGRPEGFTGLVGRFTLSTDLARDTLKTGESTTLKVTVEGDGSLAGVRLPPFQDSDAVRAYDDDPEVSAALKAGQYRAQAVFSRALVPTREGVVEIPAVPFSWFDPVEGRYVEQVIPAQRLMVTQGEGTAVNLSSFTEADSDRQGTVPRLGEDILPEHTVGRVRDQRVRGSDPVPWLLMGLPALALLVQRTRGLRMRSDRKVRQQAIRRAMADLPPERSARLSAMEAAFREAVSLATGLEAAAVDPARIRERVPGALGESLAALYQEIQVARYGGGAVPDDLVARWRDAVSAALRRAR